MSSTSQDSKESHLHAASPTIPARLRRSLSLFSVTTVYVPVQRHGKPRLSTHIMVTRQYLAVVLRAIPDSSSNPTDTPAACTLGGHHFLSMLLHILGLLWKFRHIEGLISLDEEKGVRPGMSRLTPQAALLHYRPGTLYQHMMRRIVSRIQGAWYVLRG
jgi:hypothetical protein